MRFVIRRLLLFAAALFGISIVVFAALRVLPGDVASVMAGLNSRRNGSPRCARNSVWTGR